MERRIKGVVMLLFRNMNYLKRYFVNKIFKKCGAQRISCPNIFICLYVKVFNKLTGVEFMLTFLHLRIEIFSINEIQNSVLEKTVTKKSIIFTPGTRRCSLIYFIFTPEYVLMEILILRALCRKY